MRSTKNLTGVSNSRLIAVNRVVTVVADPAAPQLALDSPSSCVDHSRPSDARTYPASS